jgi:hypothetical protein
MLRPVLPLLLSLAALCQAPAAADTRIVMVNTNEGNESLGEPATETKSTTWLAGNKLRQDDGDQSVIVDLEQKKIFVLNHVPKTYHEFDLPVDLTQLIPGRQREQYENALARMAMNVKVTVTDETAEIRGFASKKYLIEMAHPQGLQMHAEYWTTDQIDLDISQYKELILEIARLQPGVSDWMEQVLEIDGFPIKRVTTIDMLGQQVVSREELSAFEKKPAPGGHYRPPAAYAQTQIDVSGPAGGP